MAIQEYDSSLRTNTSTCLYGAGATGVITGTALTFPLTIAAATSHFRLTVNGSAFTTDAIVAAATYNTITALATAVQTAAQAVPGGAGVVVVGTSSNQLQIGNPRPVSGTNNIAVTTPSGSSGLIATQLGLSVATAPGAQKDCTLAAASPDGLHTLDTYMTAYATGATGLPLGSLTPNQSRWFRITLMLPSGSSNQLQGRQVTFAMSWTLTQS
jgi:hypothetical protein